MRTRPIQTALFICCAWVISTLLYWQVDAIHRGGSVMIPIVMCSVFSLTIVLERLYYFFSLGAGPSTKGFGGRAGVTRFFEELREAVHHREWANASTLCRNTRGPIARVAEAGLAAHEEEAQEIELVCEEAARDEQPLVERHVRWLATLAQVSTLLGLLGTVIGMVEAFQVIQSKATSFNPVSPGDLAGGIWQALITTVAGLEVAIPTILAYHYLLSRVAEVQFQMEKVTRLVAGWRRHQ